MKKRLIFITCAIIILASLSLILASCSSGSKSDSYMPESENGYGGNYSPSGPTEDSADGTPPLEEDQVSSTIDRKLIRNISIDLQTKDFDTFIETVNTGIKTYEGYIESSNIQGSSFYAGNSRYATIVARIPSAKADEFIESFPSENTNVLTRRETCEDVTLNYVDTESRLSSLRAQREALEELYQKADDVSEIAYVQKELSAVIMEIEAYESKLRELESLVSYTTIALQIREVVEYTEAEKELTFFEEIKKGFTDAWADVVSFYRGLTVFSVTSLPYLLIIAFFALFPLGALAIVFIVIHAVKRKRSKKGKDLN